MNPVTDPLLYSEAEVERWDREWLNYLLLQYQEQLTPHSAYPHQPELSENPLETINAYMGNHATLLVYAPGSAIRDRWVMEFGCGCGNLGKLIARYVNTYVGVDCSGLALAIARLVSPKNTIYLHANDVEELARLHGKIDTLVSRFFWIHQNLETGRRVLRIVEPLLKSGGRVYLDFFWPNPLEAVGFWRTDVGRGRAGTSGRHRPRWPNRRGTTCRESETSKFPGTAAGPSRSHGSWKARVWCRPGIQSCRGPVARFHPPPRWPCRARERRACAAAPQRPRSPGAPAWRRPR